jgi:hypothetical protein
LLEEARYVETVRFHHLPKIYGASRNATNQCGKPFVDSVNARAEGPIRNRIPSLRAGGAKTTNVTSMGKLDELVGQVIYVV